MTKNISRQDYIKTVLERLEDEHYKIKDNITYNGQVFDCVAKRLRFEIEKPMFIHKYFILSKFASLDADTLKAYSAKSFNYAIKTSPISWARFLICWIVCYPVAIVDTLDTVLAGHIRSKAPPWHRDAFEMPVIYSHESQELYYCEETPYGNHYFVEMRFTINNILARPSPM